MSDTKIKTEKAENEEQNEAVENSLIIRFDQPIEFEDKEYTEVDLSGLDNMTGNDMINVDNMLRARGISGALSDLSVTGIFLYAMTASKHPMEFFVQLPLREAKKVKTRILNFFWN